MNEKMDKWPDRGAVIIPYKNDGIILMRRERGYGKNKQIYYTIPGGGREAFEKIKTTARREIKEELGITITLGKLLYRVSTPKRMQYIFVGKYKSGKLGSGQGEEFQGIDYNKYGKYIPEVVSLDKLKRIKLVPQTIKKEIIEDFAYIIGKKNIDKIMCKSLIDKTFKNGNVENRKNITKNKSALHKIKRRQSAKDIFENKFNVSISKKNNYNTYNNNNTNNANNAKSGTKYNKYQGKVQKGTRPYKKNINNNNNTNNTNSNNPNVVAKKNITSITNNNKKPNPRYGYSKGQLAKHNKIMQQKHLLKKSVTKRIKNMDSNDKK